ncbi:DNA mismatch repair endonuclease MutL [Thermicanus aegyptius]|uniref:DNA mismatch repair endonuclease MutL n=1 Tax=Thermicanus aegyptius TaxID=94009 RepID=UPI00042920DC|nr:DNA mismatch repair endonuclease MutL [Thermicanus aegyptius]
MGKIRIMEEGLANKIAAGEVVERPASVVKELVENAIDAKATRIEVEVEEGGLSLIRVSDDGEGMDGEDLPLAFTRHATSKMKHERDLFHIRTLGFRGEALPSIAAVSKVEIASRVKGAPLAQTLRLEAGQVKEKGEKPLPQGTTVWVRELFFNTPARLKYMKSLTTENYHIQDILMRLALAHPNISFRLLHDGREVFRTNGSGELLHVVHSLYGTDVARKVIPISGEHPDFTLTGLIGKPEWTRGSKQYLTFIVNGRVIRSLLLQRALLEGYQTLLPVHRFPFAVLSFRMDASLVDVNVHPAKWEARFSKEEELSRWLTLRVKDHLLRTSLVPTIPVERKAAFSHPSAAGGMSPHAGYPDLYGIRKGTEGIFKETVKEASPSMHSQPNHIGTVQSNNGEPFLPDGKEPTEEEIGGYKHQKMEEEEKGENGGKRGNEGKEGEVSPMEESGRLGQMVLFRGLSLEPLAQLHDTYIIAQGEEGLYLIDQHAAQERIHYERIRRSWLMRKDERRQILAIPFTYEVAASEVAYVREAEPLIEELGIVQEPFGERTFLVREIPLWFNPGEEEKMLEGIIQVILHGKGNANLSDLMDGASKQMACKASIKANQSLSKEEMARLLEELGKAENPYTCPHGRPVLIHFSKYDLEKMFKRVM